MRAHAGQTAYDVFACSNTFRFAYVAMHDEMREGFRRFEVDFAEWPRGENVPEEAYDAFWVNVPLQQAARRATENRAEVIETFNRKIEGRDEAAAFAVAIKALYLLVRAHQDSLCALVLFVQRPRGTSFSTFIPEGGGVATDHREVVPLDEVIEALDISTQLHRAITRTATATAKPVGRA